MIGRPLMIRDRGPVRRETPLPDALRAWRDDFGLVFDGLPVVPPEIELLKAGFDHILEQVESRSPALVGGD